MSDPIAVRVARRFLGDVADKHQLKILIDTVKNPMKGLLGGPDAKEAEHILRTKFKYTDAQIHKLKHASSEGSISRPTPSADGEALFHSIKPGSRVTIKTPQGQEFTGKAVMKGPYGWVLNMGGKHGRPGIASPENIVAVK
jgi:hypothetical protein